MNYQEQIKSPKWQRRRLEILNRDNFTCQICGCQEKTLNVHHLMYDKNKEIWDYDDWQLITLCEDCHDNEHNSELKNIMNIIKSLQSKGITLFEIYTLLESVDVSIALEHDDVMLKITGNDGSSCFKENEMQDLTNRRIAAKDKLYKDNANKLRLSRERNKNVSF